MGAKNVKLRKSIQKNVLAGLMQLPTRVLETIGGGRHEKDGNHLDPHFNAILKLYQTVPRKNLNDLSPEKARREYQHSLELLSEPKPNLHRVDDINVAGVPCRLYSPAEAPSSLPLLVYYHGGGGVVGNLETCDSPCRQLSLQTGCLVISVDYRMGPEDVFPAALDDALAVFRFVRDHAERYGADATRVAVGGDSFGGCLAALVALETAEANEAGPVHQLLIYPVTDFSRSGGSRDLFRDGYLIDFPLMVWFRENCFGVDVSKIPRRASALLRPVPAGLAPATIHTAGFDPLRDEGMEYAERLKEHGVDAEATCFPGMVHGYFSFTGVSPAAADALHAAGLALTRAF